MTNDPALSIVVPVYNGAGSIRRLVDEVSMLEIAGGIEFILVVDGSPDDSLEVARDLTRTCRVPVTTLGHSRNFGEHNAVLTGLRAARGHHVITMDDDLQNPPAEVKRLYAYAKKVNKDVVYTYYANKRHAGWRNLGSWFANQCANMMFDKPRDLYLSSFRCLSRFIVDQICKYGGPYPYIDGLILQVTNSLDSIEVEHLPRAKGRSNYTLKKLISLWMILAFNFSIKPLRLCTLLGIVTSAVGGVGVISVLVEYFTVGILVPGWTLLIITVLLFSGVQLLMLGLVGEYLGRLYMTIAGQPQSAVREVYRPRSTPSVDADGSSGNELAAGDDGRPARP